MPLPACVRAGGCFLSKLLHTHGACVSCIRTCVHAYFMHTSYLFSFLWYLHRFRFIYLHFFFLTYIHTYIWACVNNVNCCINCKKNYTKCEKIWYRKRWRSRKTKSACFILHPFLPNHWEHNTLSGTLECYHTFFCVYLRCLTSYKESSKICHCQ